MALKRQQAVEDAIALRLAYNETGATMEVLPPGKIFGMNVTDPCAMPAVPSSSSSAVHGGGDVCSVDVVGIAETHGNGECRSGNDHKMQTESSIALTQREHKQIIANDAIQK